MDEFFKTLFPAELMEVKKVPSQSVFRFGDGFEAKSLKCIPLPLLIGVEKILMDVELVKNEIFVDKQRCHETDGNFF